MDIYPFDNPKEAQRFHALTKSLRCMVCQNQSLSESNAPLAIRLRNDIYLRVRLKQSEAEILAAMVQEHGAFVSYNPPLTPLSLGLWLGPFLILACGLWIAIRGTKLKKEPPCAP